MKNQSRFSSSPNSLIEFQYTSNNQWEDYNYDGKFGFSLTPIGNKVELNVILIKTLARTSSTAWSLKDGNNFLNRDW